MKRKFLIALVLIVALASGLSIMFSEVAVGRGIERLILERAADRLSLIAWSFGVTSSDVDIYAHIEFDREVLTVRKDRLIVFQYGTARVDPEDPGTRSLTRFAGDYEFVLSVDIKSAKARYIDLVRTTISVATAVFSLLFCVFGLILLHVAVDPIVRLAGSMARITSRNLQARVDEPSGDDEFSQLTRTINDLLDEIQGTYERQAQFVEDITHDIVTPVQILEGYRQLIERYGRREDLVGEFLDISKEQLGRLKAMATALKNRQAAEKRRSVERADASAITERIVRYYAGLHPSVRFVSEIKAGVFLPISEDDLARIENILLDNAVKYGTAGADDPTVTVALSEGLFSVRDRGPGIDPEERESIFDRRYRGRGTAPATEGTGLGLSILRKFAEEYGFRVRLESEQGKGAEFALFFDRP